MIETFLLDLRYAIRSLRRSPGFTALAVITLGLGIGATAAGFGIMHQVLLDPLPGVRDQARLGLTWVAVVKDGSYGVQGLGQPQRATALSMSPAVETMAGVQVGDADVAAFGLPPRQVLVDYVTGNYFSVLGVQPAVGRLLNDADDPPVTGALVVVIAFDVWRDLYGGRPDIIGQRLMVNALPFTIVGVGPRGFQGTSRFQAIRAWIPGNAYFDATHFDPVLRAKYHLPPSYQYYEQVIRIRSGASFDQAAEQLRTAVGVIAAADTQEFRRGVTATIFPGLGLQALGREVIRRQVALILGVAVLLLLISSANVTNLMLLRRIHRRADIAVRLVLGAGRWRVARLFLLESALLGVASGATGTVVAFSLREWFGSLKFLGRLSMGPVSIDGRLLAFAVACGIVVSLFAGAIPAFLGARTELAAEIKAAGPTQVGGTQRLRAGLAVLQVATALTLVAGAYLMADTLRRVATVPLGFDPAGVTVFDVTPRLLGYTENQGHTYFGQLEEQLRALPGITHVALMDGGPMRGSFHLDQVTKDGQATGGVRAFSQQVSADYFSTVGVPLLSGSSFNAADEAHDTNSRSHKAILSAALARNLFGATNPVGVRIKTRGDGDLEVVGVAGDVRGANPADTARLEYYVPVGPLASWELEVAIKSPLPTTTIVREVQNAAKGIDPSLPVEPGGTLNDRVAAAVASETLLFKLVGAVSALSLLLTAVGVYSIVAYGISTRTREFGLRVALGAGQKNLIRTALGPAPRIVGVGVAFGVLGALYLTKFIAASLYGVSRFDPLAFIAAALILAAAVLLASWLPARRAAKIDPMVALRYE